MSARRLFLLLSAFVVGGCAKVDPRSDYDQTGRRIRDATGAQNVFHPMDDGGADQYIAAALKDGLSAQEAAEVCLLNSPTLQSLFYRVGVARADLVQSQLLSNPTIGVATRFPDGGGLVDLELGVAQNLVDLWQIPLRKQVARHVLEQTILEVAQQAARLAMDAKDSYYRCVAAEALVNISRANHATTRQLVDLTNSLRRAGAASGVDVNLAIAELQEAQLDLRAASLEVYEARSELLRLLGLTSDPSALVLSDSLPISFGNVHSLETLLQTAARHRMDLEAARQELDALAKQLKLERKSVFKVVEFGVEMERDARPSSSDGSFLSKTAQESIRAGQLTIPPVGGDDDDSEYVTGPALSLEIPIFDQNQAQIAKAEFIWQQAARRVQALAIEVTAEVRLAHQKAVVAWEVAGLYERELLPLREQNLTLSREAYSAGKVSLLAVLEAQRSLQEMRAGSVRALLDSARAWVRIERTTARPAQHLIDDSSATPANSTLNLPNGHP